MVDVERTASTVTFQAEPLAAVWDEALPLMQANHRETGAFQEWRFAPAKEKLERMEAAGFLRLFTARKEGKLIGYQLFFVLFSINYPDNLESTCHVAYIVPEERGTFAAGKFLLWADQTLIDEGVYSIARQSPMMRPLGDLYARMGYCKVEENWVFVRGGDC